MKSNLNLGNKFNFENEVSLSIELEKTCFSQGELINGENLSCGRMLLGS